MEQHEEDECEKTQCRGRCRSVEHGEKIFAMGIMGDERDVVVNWNLTCSNYGFVKGEFGKTALHAATARNHDKNANIIDWLVLRKKCGIDAKEVTSGYTALHMSILHGQILFARNLISAGASLTIVDNEGLNPIELLMAEKINYLTVERIYLNEKKDPTMLSVWGSNDNFNLGTENQSERLFPEALDCFSPLNPKTSNKFVQKVIMQTFHTLFLCQNKQVYTCGVESDGRLGLGGKGKVAIAPHRIPLMDPCKNVAAGLNHTLFLMENGTVKSCGSNQNCVLGHRTHENVLHPKMIDSLRNFEVKSICTSNTHSIFYGSRMFVCGLNLGQLGLTNCPKEIFIPREIPDYEWYNEDRSGHHCIRIECSDVATLIRNFKGIVFILYRYEIKRLDMRAFGGIIMSKLCGGQQLSDSGTTPSLTLAMLTVRGIYVWREAVDKDKKSLIKGIPGSRGNAVGNFTRIILDAGPGRSLDVWSMALGINSIYVTDYDGGAYVGRWNHLNVPVTTPNINSTDEKRKRNLKVPVQLTSAPKWISASKKRIQTQLAEDAPMEIVRVKRIPNIHEAHSVTCDPKGNNFSVIQRHSKMDLVEMPIPYASTMKADMKNFLEESNLEDTVHDIVFQVGSDKFPAHCFIIASICSSLYSRVKEARVKSNGQVPVLVQLKDVPDSRLFKRILEFLYTGSCDVLIAGSKIGDSYPNLIQELIPCARRFKLESLAKPLRNFELINGIVAIEESSNIKPSNRKFMERERLLDLSDVNLLCSDKTSVPVHKCILVARMEYFNKMIMSGAWRESSNGDIKMSWSKLTVEILMDFIYEENVSRLKSLEPEQINEVFMAADLYCMTEFKSYVEIALVDMTNLKNVAQILTLAYLYGAEQLKIFCMNFVCLNLAPLLENRLLDDVTEEIMYDVGVAYRSYHKEKRRTVKAAEFDLPPKENYPEEVAKCLAEYEEFVHCKTHGLGFEELFQKTKTSSPAVTKPKKIRHRTRTLSSDSEGESGSNLSLSFSEENKNKFESNYSSIPENKVHVPENETKGKQIPKTKTSLPDVKEEIFNSMHFPSLSKLTENPDNFQELPIAGPSKSRVPISSPIPIPIPTAFQPQQNSGQKKKTKWMTLGEKLAKQNPKVNSSPIEMDRDPVNPWTKFAKSPTGTGADSMRENLESPIQSQSGSSVPKGNESTSAPPTPIPFREIVNEEQELIDNLTRATEKPLRLVEIEELAIQQLTARYTTDDTALGYETVSVERVSSTRFANPTWPRPPLGSGSGSASGGKSPSASSSFRR